jgi:transglutaminase-like putative cysteine protease
MQFTSQLSTDSRTQNRQVEYPINSRLGFIPDGRAGTLATLKLMRQLVRNSKTSLPIRSLAVRLTNGENQKDWLSEVKRLHAFVRDRIRYVKDITDVETVHTPEAVLQFGAGDCDDKSVLLASLLESIGHPTRFVAIGFKPDDFSHVLVETLIGKSWVPLETTEPVEIGWYPPGVVSRLVVHN